jgi:hypothetical protein
MTPARLAAASALLLVLAPVAARADALCDQFSKATELASGGFASVEGEPISNDPDNHYWRSTLQLSSGGNCAVEAHKVLTCAWEPSTAADLKTMTDSVAACFPSAKQTPQPDPSGGPAGASFRVNDASIDVGLTADVLSLSVGP